MTVGGGGGSGGGGGGLAVGLSENKIGHVMTLANSIIGVAILAMPFCFQKCGIILSILLIIAINLITRICCHYLVKSSILCRRKSMEIMAYYIFGSSGKLMVELCVIGYLMGTCVAYFVVVGDLGPQIIAKLFEINNTQTLRTWTMILVTLFCVLPLGMLKNVDSLSTVCMASIGFYFCLVIKIMAEAEHHIRSGDWLEHVEFWKWSGVLQCLPIFSLSLSCQMVIFEVYDTVSNVTLEKMNSIVKSAIFMCTCVYILVGFFGYVAFCQQPFSGNILLNLEPTIGSDVIKIGFVLSVACSFPLVIFPCRASLYSLLYRRGHSDVAHYIPEHRFKLITVCLIVLAMIVGILIPSIELIIGLVGSTIGVAICIMFPASCYIKLGKKNSAEKLLAQMLLVFGFFLMVLGTYANLMAIDESNASVIDEIAAPAPPIPSLELPASLGANRTDDDLSEKVQFDRNLPDDDAMVKEINLEEPSHMKSLEDFVPKAPDKNVLLKPVAAADKPRKWLSDAKSADLSKNDINSEALMREDQEIALDEAKELEKTKDSLIEQVQEIKDEMKKQNEETQNMVSKLEEIVNKVEHIEAGQKMSVEQTEPKVAENPIVNMLIKNQAKANVSSGERTPMTNATKIDLTPMESKELKPDAMKFENVSVPIEEVKTEQPAALQPIKVVSMPTSAPFEQSVKPSKSAEAADVPSSIVDDDNNNQLKPSEEKLVDSQAPVGGGHNERELLSVNEPVNGRDEGNGVREKRNVNDDNNCIDGSISLGRDLKSFEEMADRL